MADKSTTELELLITANADKFSKELSTVNRQLDSLKAKKKDAEGIGAGFKSALPDMTKFGLAASAGGIALGAATAAMTAFVDKQKGMAELSAITGITGEKLGELEDAAVALSNEFGGSAIDNIEAFKGVLSRLGPAFGQSTSAMETMGRNINTLAVAGGIDAPAAMDALTTSMLQFGVSLKDPEAAAARATEMMNTLAAGAQAGAAEIPQVSEAIKQVGVAAKASNLSFEEVNAGIQALAAGGKTGSEAGVALRNVLGLLVKQSGPGEAALKGLGTSTAELGKVLTSQGLNAALGLLGSKLDEVKDPAQRLAIQMQLFGTENSAAAGIMLDAARASDGQASALQQLTEAVTGTQSAFEQAGTIQDTISSKLDRLGSRAENLGASLAEGTYEVLAQVSGYARLDDSLQKLDAREEEAEKQERAPTEQVIKSNTERLKSVTFTEAQQESFRKLAFEGNALTETYLRGANAIRAFYNAQKQATGGTDVDPRKVEAERLRMEFERLKSGTAGTNEELAALKSGLDAFVDSAQRGTAEFKTFSQMAERIQNILNPKKEAKKAAKGEGADGILSTIGLDEEGRKRSQQALDFYLNTITDDITKWPREMQAALIATAGTAEEQKRVAAMLGFKDWPPKNTLEDMKEEWDKAIMEVDWEAPNPLDKVAKEMTQTIDLVKIGLDGLGQAVSASFEGGEDAAKNALRPLLLALVDFLEAKYLVGAADAVISAIINPLSITWNTALLAAGLASVELARAAINSFDVGTLNVPSNQIAMVHRGEMIVPQSFAESVRRGEAVIGGGGGDMRRNPSSAIRQQRAGAFDVTARIDESGFRSVSSRDTYRRGARTF